MTAIAVPGIALRPVAATDEAFLARLYATTRDAEMHRTGWSEAQRACFLAMQFKAQQRAYQAYPDAEFLLMLRHGETIGRLYLQHNACALRVIDLSLLPEHQHQGIGGSVLAAVLALAGSTGKTVDLHVERHNRAQALYRRLGFRTVQDNGIYRRMVWDGPRSLAEGPAQA
ncbi:GNAT family N-acetyltransferase [Cupriavidus alkaliphilus]|uniref:Ribosomal protein S18 acetylase RimI-like enzyme n=1 Tax=Cupriavidus alkaliphilus TaxID=942866 RepID=A0A7W4V8J1_9BURK|nr:GNAT family N-acetyltransferase [Cupriavidus alkaliphilus]MBB3006594.1 ribosomal protein S18 acetylase RimI-like enzyme [Cupriavidus alkaliphilus]PVY80720.1 ribosomal protein S18 acetylase RimI-like enzyme [Cupriavidus alkaliphilus]SCB14548.1 Ribosomal protein S18 acetylase RimI [Cupriavidus alkaliphilus]